MENTATPADAKTNVATTQKAKKNKPLVPLNKLVVPDPRRTGIVYGETYIVQVLSESTEHTDEYERFWFRRANGKLYSFVIFYDSDRPVYVCDERAKVVLTLQPKLSLLKRVHPTIMLSDKNNKGELSIGSMGVIRQFE